MVIPIDQNRVVFIPECRPILRPICCEDGVRKFRKIVVKLAFKGALMEVAARVFH